MQTKIQLTHKDVCKGVAALVSTTAVGTPPGRVPLTSGVVAASVGSSVVDISSLLSVVVMLSSSSTSGVSPSPISGVSFSSCPLANSDNEQLNTNRMKYMDRFAMTTKAIAQVE